MTRVKALGLDAESFARSRWLVIVLGNFFEKFVFSSTKAAPAALLEKIKNCCHQAGHEDARILHKPAVRWPQ